MLLADSVRDLKCINKRIYSFKQAPLHKIFQNKPPPKFNKKFNANYVTTRISI